MAHILIIDDEKILAESLCMLFRDEGHQASFALDGQRGLATAIANAPDIIVLDLRLPDISGLEVLKQLQAVLKETMIIMMTAHGDTSTIVEAVKSGAFHYLNKPFELDEITLLVNKALEQQQLKEEVHFLRGRNGSPRELQDIVGECEAMADVFNKVQLVAKAGDSAVLITGESGTGKELIASALHRLSDRKDQAFVEVNCAAIPESLLESELFGYEKGAFTDAGKRKKGLVELAQNGTLFLDEIGEMPLHLQAKLLRFLEKKSFRRVGGTVDMSVNARIVAATNRNLPYLVQQRKFREDLYYRLNVIPVRLPALRDRDADVRILAEHFLNHFAMRLGQPVKQLSSASERAFLNYLWPGNVRELKNIIERLVILCPSSVIPVEQLPEEILYQSVAGDTDDRAQGDFNIDEHLLDVERKLISDALAQAHGKKMLAAQQLGISRHALKRKLQKLQLAGDDEG